jgi:hypothetical protein
VNRFTFPFEAALEQAETDCFPERRALARRRYEAFTASPGADIGDKMRAGQDSPAIVFQFETDQLTAIRLSIFGPFEGSRANEVALLVRDNLPEAEIKGVRRAVGIDADM